MKKLLLNKAGFTLAELMAVVAIIAILSAVALGSYRKAIERSSFNEGEQMVHALAAAADAYYEENKTWPIDLCSLDVSIANRIDNGCTTQQTKNFTYVFSGDGSNHFVIASSRTGNNYTLRAYTEADGFKKADGSLKQTECSGNDDFCTSVGYKNCSSSNNICTKY